MVHVVVLEEMCELIRSKWRTIDGVEQTRWSVLQGELKQVLGQGLGGFGRYCKQEGVLAEKVTYQQILFTLVGKVVSSNLPPWAIRDIPWKHRLSRGRGLVLSADCAPADIVCYVSIYARTIHCPSCLCLHLVYPLMCSMQVGKGAIDKFWGNADLDSFKQEA